MNYFLLTTLISLSMLSGIEANIFDRIKHVFNQAKHGIDSLPHEAKHNFDTALQKGEHTFSGITGDLQNWFQKAQNLAEELAGETANNTNEKFTKEAAVAQQHGESNAYPQIFRSTFQEQMNQTINKIKSQYGDATMEQYVITITLIETLKNTGINSNIVQYYTLEQFMTFVRNFDLTQDQLNKITTAFNAIPPCCSYSL